MLLIDGAMADGGGEFTVVSVLLRVVLFEVLSVTMAWASTEPVTKVKIQLVIIFIIHIQLLVSYQQIFTYDRSKDKH